jgi:hypothetical protein
MTTSRLAAPTSPIAAGLLSCLCHCPAEKQQPRAKHAEGPQGRERGIKGEYPIKLSAKLFNKEKR